MRDMIARLRRQREEEAKAGLQHFEDQLDAIGERLGEIDDRLESLTVAAADAPQLAAALLLVSTISNSLRDDRFCASGVSRRWMPFGHISQVWSARTRNTQRRTATI